MRKVLWIPTPPSAGIVSMQRCFGALDMEVSKGDAEGLERYQISPLVPFTGLISGSRSRLAKAMDKWLVYFISYEGSQPFAMYFWLLVR